MLITDPFVVLGAHGISAFSALAHGVRGIMSRAPRCERQGIRGQR
ncbi:hypothetical protein SLI_4901 [Streptomyces lividans 1326]|uniref:Uncharacterized protein n=1 Tax=Streptomyces lividans 1326 TaxID=1200984 RepID=A0A7U9DT61_STRLI|nr:hypothetical protein SLI_4901 [Streptomyces lividans 1326]